MKVNTDRILSFTAILTSILTFSIFVYQTNIIYEQNRLSVRPRLAVSTELAMADSTFSMTLIVSNKGLGPAIIESATIFDRKKRYKLSIDYLEEVYPDIFSKWLIYISAYPMNPGVTISKNEFLNIFYLEFRREDMDEVQEYLKFLEDDADYDIVITYKSMYEEIWKVGLNSSLKPVSIN